MKKLFKVSVIVMFALVLGAPVYATNGDNLIGVGSVSRAMGGAGIAAPQDAVSAVFANPAAMCFGPYCPTTEFDFGGTLFVPNVKGQVSGQAVGGKIKSDSRGATYAMPAIGLSVPISKGLNPPIWRFGLAAYGVSGLGVDYKDRSLDQPKFFNFGPMGQFPLVAGEYTQLSTMRFAPAIAYQPSARWSVGLAGIVDYSNLDLGHGSNWQYAFGIQTGAIFKPIDNFSLGLNYISPRKADYRNVSDFDGDGSLDDLKLESPQEIGLGAAYSFSKLLFETDVKWLNWDNADGYEDFDWDNQWVFVFAVQYQPIPKLFLRAGYNYAKQPLNKHNNFTGTASTKVQGKSMPKYYYETFRTIGFPAIIEHHLTLGIGYEFSPKFAVNLGYVHGFKESFSESGTAINGLPVKIKSELYEDSIDFGLTFRF